MVNNIAAATRNNVGATDYENRKKHVVPIAAGVQTTFPLGKEIL